ncbi:PAP2-domain-containing protein [Ophiobolus disseminans]|uniref:PAP2-domain-containing protein n=1 Tax=Ophiobolus disseminans TaxID=1469910 RepID=A0A6A6ZSI6_9PLEO|nr:PAP2-domain-containing protein [Ophiobolus disseminans]
MVEEAPPPESSVAALTASPPKRMRADSSSSSSIESTRSVRTLASEDLEYVHENGRTYGNDTYFLPCVYLPNNDFKQQDLLSLQHQVFLHALQGKLTTTRILPSTRRILDLGTGPGHWAVAMAQKYPRSEVVGIDMTEWDLNTTEATLGESKVIWEIDDLDVWGREPDLDTLTARLEQFDFFTDVSNRKPIDSPTRSRAQTGIGGLSQAGTSSESLLADPYTLVGQPTPGWHFSDVFELIHLRNMKGAFAHWEEVYAEIFKSLSPGGWVEIADYDLGEIPRPAKSSNKTELPLPTLRRLYASAIEASFKSGRPIGTFYMHASYLEEAGFTDIQTTQVNVPVGPWPRDEKQKSIGKLMLVVLMEMFEASALRLLGKYGDREKVWTLEEIETQIAIAQQEIAEWNARAEQGEVEGWRIAHDVINSPGFIGAAARFWQRSYASDYVGLAILITGYILIQFLAEPFHRMFFLDNLAIGYPHAEVERVPVSWLFIYAGAVPLGTLILWALLVRPGTHKAHVTLLGWFISMILTLFITDVIKNAVGRPRPDLIARCKPAPGTPAHELVTFEVCTETDHHVLHDGWRSFPSGHSSFSFSGLGYLSLFIAGQCHVYRPRADLARVLLALAPLLGAALIAISRCEDYRHDVYDVTVGSVLGMAVAHYTYRRYYPALRNRNCASPFANPMDEAGVKGFRRVKDDEEALRGAGEFELEDISGDEEEERVRR